MTILYINTGTSANAGNGDSIRLAFTKVNNNFEDLLGRLVNAQFPNVYVGSGYFGFITSTGTFTTVDLISTGSSVLNDLSILGNVNGPVNFTDTSTFVNITVTDTATVNHVATQYLTVANTATFNSDIVVNGNYIGTLTLAGTSTFDNIIVNNTATLNDLTINGSVTAGFYQGFDDFNIIKDDINGLNFRLRNIHSDSFTEYNLLDNISGGLTIAHQNSTNDSGRYLAGQNYIIGLTPSDTLNIGRYSDIKFYADAPAYASHHEIVPVLTINSNDQQIYVTSSTIYLNDIPFQVASDGSATVNGYPVGVNLSSVAQDIIPSEDSVYDLGSPEKQWKSLYVSTNTIYINNVPISVDTATNTLQVGEANTTTVVNVATENFVYNVFSSFSTSTLVNGDYAATLGSDGVLTFPNNSTFDGQTLTDSATGANYTLKVVNGGEDGSKFCIGTGSASFGIANDALNHAEDGYVPYSITAQRINLTVLGAGSWTFGADGGLMFPDGSKQTSAMANGFTGSAGTNGTNGYTGSVGYTGSTGVRGYTGSAGTNGYAGSAGTNGTNGAIGYTGSIGITGYVGSLGAHGYTGSAGTNGNNGYTGSAGTNGTNGTNGAIGYTGSAGSAGSNGVTGYAGSIGIIGYAGSRGYTGSAGTNGFTGSAGTNGFTGSTGTNGSNGATGYTGSVGTNGTNGATGYTGSIGLTGSFNGSTSTQVQFTNATASTSTTTGALVVTGGVGVGGTVTANKFVGDGSSLTNVTVTQQANIVGVQPNVTLVAGNYSYLFDNAGNFTMPANGDIAMSGSASNITAGGIVTAGVSTNTAFIAGNGAVNNIALGYQPTSGAANMAIRDLSTVTTIMYFDAGSNTTSTNSQFLFRSSSAYTTWGKFDQYGLNLPTRPAFRVYGAGTTNNLSTTVNTNGILNGNNFAVDYNQGTALSTSTGVFTAPVAGLYSIHLVARVTSNSAGQAQVTVIKNNGLGSQANQAMWETGPNPSINHFGASTISKLAAGDTLVLKVTLGSINFDANDSWAVAYIG